MMKSFARSWIWIIKEADDGGVKTIDDDVEAPTSLCTLLSA